MADYDEVPMTEARETLVARVEALEKRLVELREVLEEQGSLLRKVAREVGH